MPGESLVVPVDAVEEMDERDAEDEEAEVGAATSCFINSASIRFAAAMSLTYEVKFTS